MTAAIRISTFRSQSDAFDLYAARCRCAMFGAAGNLFFILLLQQEAQMSTDIAYYDNSDKLCNRENGVMAAISFDANPLSKRLVFTPGQCNLLCSYYKKENVYMTHFLYESGSNGVHGHQNFILDNEEHQFRFTLLNPGYDSRNRRGLVSLVGQSVTFGIVDMIGLTKSGFKITLIDERTKERFDIERGTDSVYQEFIEFTAPRRPSSPPGKLRDGNR